MTHFGFRYWHEGKAHTQRDFFSIGAAYIKPIKCGHWRSAVLFFSAPLLRSFWQPFADILHGKKPRGFGRIVYFIQGAIQGLRTPIDCRYVLYQSKGAGEKFEFELGNDLKPVA